MGQRHRTTSVERVQRALFTLVAIVTILFALITPPFQAPDEPQHFSRAIRLAHGEVFAEQRGGAVGGEIAARYARLPASHFSREAFGVPTRYTLADLSRAAASQPKDDAATFVEFANVANYAPTLYLPQAIGVAISEWIGASALACFYLSRLANALAFLALLWAALRVTPIGGTVLATVAALPTVAYQSGSVSPDATINGLAWLVLALSLAAGTASTDRVRGCLIAASAPLGLCKGLYAPVALVGIRSRRSAAWCVAGFLAAVIAFVGWTLMAGSDQAVYVVESRTTGQLVHTAPLSAQLHVVLGNPVGYLRVLVSSMADRSPVYALQLVGRFGWNAILLPLVAYPLSLAMLVLAAVVGLGGSAAPLQRGWWLVIGIGVVVLVETALYLTGTPLAADYVQGVQGRYFLPVLPLFLMAVAPARPLRFDAGRWVIVMAVLLNIMAVATVLDAFWGGGFTNVRGLPPFAHDPGGLARAMLLPSPRW